MLWAGSTVNLQWRYTPLTSPAVRWMQVSDGNWKAVDRGISEDIFESRVNFKGTRAELETLETTILDANRNTFSITTANTGEELFGADVDHSGTLTVSVVKYGQIKQHWEEVYSMELTLRLESPAFKSVAQDLTTLRLSSFQSAQFSEFDVKKQWTYDHDSIFTDRETDPGFLIGTFTQTESEMAGIRRYLLVDGRTANILWTNIIFGGITTPFGDRMGTGLTVNVIEWKDLGRINKINWGLSLKFARVYT